MEGFGLAPPGRPKPVPLAYHALYMFYGCSVACAVRGFSHRRATPVDAASMDGAAAEESSTEDPFSSLRP